ncbi:Pyrrolo-quinoline quinone [Haladaptatus sp. R4]|uniref:outer membrane protein assembly factor BamB family protein n=1 Tax=Haladaptatus sp. R4 TaxID=1679489 RepID=UPI0007B47CB8|nr:PQQ-binding-like beta-propeller repeat protein [Haladaptatus sp. R4]KZN24701.1 Pyrrolo-quinoline quinone [Haladaptatus sp. R4]
MGGRSSRRNFLGAIGLGLSVVSAGCNTLEAQPDRQRPNWSVELDGMPARARSIADHGLVLATTLTPDGELGHLRFSGDYERLADLSRITTAPVVYDDRAFVESDGTIRSIPLDGGDPVQIHSGYLSLGRYEPVVSGSRLFGIGYNDEFEKYTVFAIDLEAERVRWIRPFGSMQASIATDGDHVFAASPSGIVRAYSANDGATIWKTHVGGDARLTYHDGTVFVATDRGLVALDSTDGTHLWLAESHWIASVNGVPAVADSTVYTLLTLYSTHHRNMFATETYLVAYHASGAERWRTRVNYGTPLTVTEDAIGVETVDEVETDRGKRELRKYLSVFATGGKRLAKYDLPDRSTMRPLIRDNSVIAGYGKTVASYER